MVEDGVSGPCSVLAPTLVAAQLLRQRVQEQVHLLGIVTGARPCRRELRTLHVTGGQRGPVGAPSRQHGEGELCVVEEVVDLVLVVSGGQPRDGELFVAYRLGAQPWLGGFGRCRGIGACGRARRGCGGRTRRQGRRVRGAGAPQTASGKFGDDVVEEVVDLVLAVAGAEAGGAEAGLAHSVGGEQLTVAGAAVESYQGRFDPVEEGIDVLLVVARTQTHRVELLVADVRRCRSEERRVGKECRSGGCPWQSTNKGRGRTNGDMRRSTTEEREMRTEGGVIRGR